MNFKEISMPYRKIKKISKLTRDKFKSILKINKDIIIFSNNFYYKNAHTAINNHINFTENPLTRDNDDNLEQDFKQ
ncbi:hypothetical protein bhYOR_000746 [Borrelia nietonii YOR]|nr:hypothetical protein [Borrelia nietonii]UPA09419.1 hypothetical protein bhYOR_000746 [Borrelia nietonii YOR]